MTIDEILKRLRELSNKNPKDLAGMARFGINTENALVISIPNLRKLAKEAGKNHKLALKVWDSGFHEAKILAGMIDEPDLVTEKQMEKWVRDFDSWDICDQVCSNLFDKTKFAEKKVFEWTKSNKEFIKRAGFVLMATLSVHDKEMPDKTFKSFLKIIEENSTDERNFVRKAVNWALRQIAKSRDKNLYAKGLKTAYKIQKKKDKTAKWIANNAVQELEKEYIKRRFN